MNNQVKKLEAKYQKAIAEGRRMALVQAVKSSKDMTLGNFMEFVENVNLINMKVGEVFFGESPEPPSKNNKNTLPKMLPAAVAAANTRTAKGRESYDKAVYEALKTSKPDWEDSTSVRKVAGGTELQFRKSIGRLLTAKKAKSKGKARAKRYQAI